VAAAVILTVVVVEEVSWGATHSPSHQPTLVMLVMLVVLLLVMLLLVMLLLVVLLLM
jgi:hypothetical protein